MLKPPSTAFWRHSFSNCLLRSRNVGTQQRTRKNDPIDATQDATTHHPDKKGNTKRLWNKILGPKKKMKKLTSMKCVALMMKAWGGQSTSTQNDVDSEVSFEDDADEEIDTTVIEEDWIEFIKRSTEDAMEKMERAKIRCWNRTHKKMKWKLALRIASPSERWLNKAAEWNPELSSRYRTNRANGRPRKRWEDDINEFLKQEFEENENPIESNNQTNKTWINIAKDRGRWALLEETYTMTVWKWQKLKWRQQSPSKNQ